MHPLINLVYIEALWNGLSRILRHTSRMCFKGKVYLVFSLYIRIYSFPFTFVIFEFRRTCLLTFVREVQ